MESRMSRYMTWSIALFAVMAIMAIDLPTRFLDHWAYAAQQGRIRANSDELAKITEVSHVFRLVANIARPGVVRINVRPGEAEREALAEARRKRAELEDKFAEIDKQIDQSGEESIDREEALNLLRESRRLQAQEQQLESLSPASGSGFIIDAEGYVLTNNHVVDSRSEITVTLEDEREFPGRIIGADPPSDIALLKIDAPDLTPLRMGNSDEMEVGDWVLAVGAPFGLSQSVSHGIISAKGRTDLATGRNILYQDFLQTDAAINPGNSGGPLLNLKGEVIGINTAIAANEQGVNAGVAFTIPANMATRIAKQLREHGEVARGWLGITMADLTAPDREVLGLAPGRGVLVNGILDDTPAAKAGLRVEDAIVEVNGRPVPNMSHLRGMIGDVFPGEQAKLEIIRDGAAQQVVIEMARRPKDGELNRRPAETTYRQVLGLPLRLRTWLPTFAAPRGHGTDDRGVLVLEDFEPEVGDKLDQFDLIVQCDGATVRSVADLEKAIQQRTGSGDEVKLLVQSRDSDRRTVRLRLSKS